MDTPQWPQGIGVVKPMESGPKVSSSASGAILERRARPVKDQALNCPRCNSTNTKFCYYNNYSLSQPRYFCKTCRRYWTEGGSLRNVPVGGGSRKNKRSTPSSSSSSTTTSSTSTLPSSSSKKLLPDLMTPPPPQQSFPHHHHQSASQNPKIHQGQDLNLAYPPPPPLPNNSHHDDYSNNNNINSISSSNNCSAAMELLKSGIASSRGLNSFMPMSLSDSSNTMYSSAGLIPMQEFKPSTAGLNFSLEGFENGYGAALQGIHHQEEGSAGARVLFPVEDLKQHQVQSSNHHHHHHAEFVEQNRSHQGDSTGYCWNGMLGGGSW